MGNTSWVAHLGSWYGGRTGHAMDYFLMTRPSAPPAAVFHVPGITVARMHRNNETELFPLQRGYELEEVMLDPLLFRERICRANLHRILTEQHVFAALDTGGTPLAKANTNALGITCEQIGGVYTLPEHRRRGLAGMVMEALIRDIDSRGRKACLFVNQANGGAVRLYRRCGFEIRGEFRITYPGHRNT